MERIELLIKLCAEIDQKIQSYKKKTRAYEEVFADYKNEILQLTPTALPVASITNDDGATSIDAGNVEVKEFSGKTQAEGARILITRSGKGSLHIGELVTGLEAGGILVGGHDFQKKKDNLSSSLSRHGGFASVGAGLWGMKNSQSNHIDIFDNWSETEANLLRGKEKEADVINQQL